jgi:hypothetical protein
MQDEAGSVGSLGGRPKVWVSVSAPAWGNGQRTLASQMISAVVRARIELATSGFSDRRSTN